MSARQSASGSALAGHRRHTDGCDRCDTGGSLRIVPLRDEEQSEEAGYCVSDRIPAVTGPNRGHILRLTGSRFDRVDRCDGEWTAGR